jgi:hypothetical protein
VARRIHESTTALTYRVLDAVVAEAIARFQIERALGLDFFLTENLGWVIVSGHAPRPGGTRHLRLARYRRALGITHATKVSPIFVGKEQRKLPFVASSVDP